MGKASTFSTKNSPKGKQKGSGKSGSKSVPSPFPKSAFKKAIWKKGGNLKKPKKPDLLHYTGHQPGVMTMFLVDGYNDKKDSFRVYDVKNLKENDDLAEELQITSVTFRKGEDGMKMPQSPSKPNYGWRMYVSIIGENNNTPEGRKAIAENLKNEFNKNATRENYPQGDGANPVVLGKDLTSDMMGPCDDAMLDKDVLELILLAYPENSADEILEWEAVISEFWGDVEHGQDVLRNHINKQMGNDESSYEILS